MAAEHTLHVCNAPVQDFTHTVCSSSMMSLWGVRMSNARTPAKLMAMRGQEGSASARHELLTGGHGWYVHCYRLQHECVVDRSRGRMTGCWLKMCWGLDLYVETPCIRPSSTLCLWVRSQHATHGSLKNTSRACRLPGMRAYLKLDMCRLHMHHASGLCCRVFDARARVSCLSVQSTPVVDLIL